MTSRWRYLGTQPHTWTWVTPRPDTQAAGDLMRILSGQQGAQDMCRLLQQTAQEMEHATLLMQTHWHRLSSGATVVCMGEYCSIIAGGAHRSPHGLMGRLRDLWNQRERELQTTSSPSLMLWLYARVVQRAVGLLLEVAVVACHLRYHYDDDRPSCAKVALQRVVESPFDRWQRFCRARTPPVLAARAITRPLHPFGRQKPATSPCTVSHTAARGASVPQRRRNSSSGILPVNTGCDSEP